ncbi:MAG: NAD(P)/FAD-dependent oxidoreductase [Chloroflexota bacterium]
MIQRKRILVLGGGSGGVATAAELGRTLGEKHEIVLVDRSSRHVYMPALLMLMTGNRTSRDITRDLDRMARHNVRFIQSAIQGIDPEAQTVHLADGQINYDYLVISLGLQTHPEAIPGLQVGAQHAWELDAAERCRDALDEFRGGDIVVGLPPGTYRCPPAPYETLFQMDWFLNQRGIRKDSSIHFFSPNSEPTGPPDSVPVWLDTHARERGVDTHYGFNVQEIDADGRRVLGSDGQELRYDILFVVPPHRPAQVLLDSGLAGPAGVQVDPNTLTTQWEHVWAIGDGADFPGSKAGVVAHQQAAVVAHNIAVRLGEADHEERLKLHTT